jgi:hypothetical protein
MHWSATKHEHENCNSAPKKRKEINTASGCTASYMSNVILSAESEDAVQWVAKIGLAYNKVPTLFSKIKGQVEYPKSKGGWLVYTHALRADALTKFSYPLRFQNKDIYTWAFRSSGHNDSSGNDDEQIGRLATGTILKVTGYSLLLTKILQ